MPHKTGIYPNTLSANPTQMRWDPLLYPVEPTDFIDGLITYAHHGDVSQKNAAKTLLYAINQSMTTRFFIIMYGNNRRLHSIRHFGNPII